MDTTTILTSLAIIFIVITMLDDLKKGGRLTPARRAWLMVAGIFAIVTIANEWLRLY